MNKLTWVLFILIAMTSGAQEQPTKLPEKNAPQGEASTAPIEQRSESEEGSQAPEEPVAKEEVLQPVENAPAEGTSEEVSELQRLLNSLRPYEMSSAGDRDPYQRYKIVVEKKVQVQKSGKKKMGLGPLQQWDLKELELVGVIWGVERPKAMVKDPSGKLHYVSKNGRMGLNDGYVAVIRDSEIVVVEAFNTDKGMLYQTQLMKVKR